MTSRRGRNLVANPSLAVEDFPIMPAEIAQVLLKPFNFCLFNPTNDVPPSTQEHNQSMLYEDTNGVANGTVNGVHVRANACH